MFSDHWREGKLVLGVIAMVSLGLVYAQQSRDLPVGWRRCIAAPDIHDGRRLVFSLYKVTAVTGPERFEISKVVSDVPVEGDSTGLAVGMTVSVVGAFEADGPSVRLEQLEVHRLRWAKRMLSLLGLLGVLCAAPLVFRFRNGRLEERAHWLNPFGGARDG